MNEKGNAVLAGLINISAATLVTLSLLALALAGYYNLVIRDAAIAAASQSARYGAPPAKDFLLRRLDVSIPHLASHQILERKGPNLTEITVEFSLPGVGLASDAFGRLSVAAATERL